MISDSDRSEGRVNPADIPAGAPCPICGPKGHGRHEDDSYGSCSVCREYVAHTDEETFLVAFPCAVVREHRAVAAYKVELAEKVRALTPIAGDHRGRPLGVAREAVLRLIEDPAPDALRDSADTWS